MDLSQEADRVKGKLWRENVLYDLYGKIDQSGTMTNAVAGKSAAYNGAVGPRFLKVDLHFSETTAEGYYRTDTSSGIKCTTAVKLTPHEAQ